MAEFLFAATSGAFPDNPDYSAFKLFRIFLANGSLIS
jgi:hypothetical protein